MIHHFVVPEFEMNESVVDVVLWGYKGSDN